MMVWSIWSIWSIWSDWEAEGDDDVCVDIEDWESIFGAMMDSSKAWTPFGSKLVTALESHIDALNSFASARDASRFNFKACVDRRISTLKNKLDHARRVLQASAGLNVSNIAPTAIAASNFWNPVGFVAGAVAIAANVAALGCKVGGEANLTELSQMIGDSHSVVQEETKQNPLCRTATTMLPLVTLLKDKLPDEKVSQAYGVLLATLVACSHTQLIDQSKLPTVVAQLRSAVSTRAFQSLLRHVRGASLSLGSVEDAVQRFGPAMREAIKRLKHLTICSTTSTLAIIVGFALVHLPTLDRGLQVLVGSVVGVGAQLGAAAGQIDSVANVGGKLTGVMVALPAFAVVGGLVSMGIGIAELVQMDDRLEPFAAAIDEFACNNHKFANEITSVLDALLEVGRSH